jgi:hypothetical protein
MKRKPKPPFVWEEYRRMAESADSALAERTFVFPTDFSDYLVRFRTIAIARPTIMKLLANEAAANELWRICDTGEIEDLLAHLRQHPPSAELVATVMLTGRSKLRQHTQASSGGKAKASPYEGLKAQVQQAWKQDKSRRSAAAFADHWYDKKTAENKTLEDQGKAPIKLPREDTVRKWLAGIEKETRK